MPRANLCKNCGHGASWHVGKADGTRGACFWPCINHGTCICKRYVPTLPVARRSNRIHVALPSGGYALVRDDISAETINALDEMVQAAKVYILDTRTKK